MECSNSVLGISVCLVPSPIQQPHFPLPFGKHQFRMPVRCECCQEVGWVEFLFPWPLTVMSFQGLLTQSSLDSCIHSFHAPPLHTAAHSFRPIHSSAPAYLEQWIFENVCVGNVSRDGILFFFLSVLQFLSVDLNNWLPKTCLLCSRPWVWSP